jgi:hypothetical protein
MDQDDERLDDLDLDGDDAERIVGGAPAQPPATPPGVPIPYPNSG